MDRFNNCYITFSLQGWSINRTILEFLMVTTVKLQFQGTVQFCRNLSSMSQKQAASIFIIPNYTALTSQKPKIFNYTGPNGPTVSRVRMEATTKCVVSYRGTNVSAHILPSFAGYKSLHSCNTFTRFI